MIVIIILLNCDDGDDIDGDDDNIVDDYDMNCGDDNK
jgi:hypothetical protein